MSACASFSSVATGTAAANADVAGALSAMFADEVMMAAQLGHVHVQAPVKVELEVYDGTDEDGTVRTHAEVVDTTPGRVIFNTVLPREMGYSNQAMDRKALKAIIARCYRDLGPEATAKLVDGIKAVGFRYATAAGITIGPSGAVAVNPRMRTPHDGVWAAGDCAEALHLVSHQPVNYHLGTIANKQGRVCGINIGGGYATFPGVLGTAVSRLCDVEVARTGLSEAELGSLGLEWESAAVDSTTRASYFPGTAPIRIKVLAERRSGRLLGAQIVGKEGAAKRIDVFATAIWNGMAVDEMVNLDLSYAPPFSPVWDPVLIAVRKATEQVERTLPDWR